MCGRSGALAHKLYRSCRHVVEMRADAGQRRFYDGGHHGVVEADNADIFRNFQLQTAQRMNGADCRFLVHGDQSSRPAVAVQRAQTQTQFTFHECLIAQRCFQNKIRLKQTGFAHIMLVIAAARLQNNALCLVQQALGTEISDAYVTERTQIVQRLFHAQLEIRNNGIIQQFVGGRIQKRNIAADAAQRLNLFVGKIADGNDAVHTGGG